MHCESPRGIQHESLQTYWTTEFFLPETLRRLWFAEHASGYWPPGKEIFPGTLNIKPSPNYHLCMCSKLLQSCPALCDPMDCSCQAPLSTGFSRQDTGVGCHGLLQGTLPSPGIYPVSLASPALQADCLLLSYWESPSIITQDWYS